jgi:peptidoglycan DL-endopeptidase CwlO
VAFGRLILVHVSVGALVQQVGEVLGRAHSLFGTPAVGEGLGASSGLAGAGSLVRGGAAQMGGLSGVLPASYGIFADDAGPTLDNAAGADGALNGQISTAATSDALGHSTSGAVLTAASTDTSTLAPVSGTPGGQRALVAALRARVAEQLQVVNAYRQRDARLAAMLRNLRYSRRGGGNPIGSTPFSGIVGGGGGLGGLSSLGSLAGLGSSGGHGGATLASKDSPLLSGSIASQPGAGAALAALSKRGRPYVWGAKGPDKFDCSGLVQWAWSQAGVKLGGTTWAQITEGVAVPPGQVRAGDMIFPLDCFGEGGVSGPGHVQLAISPNQVVHAPQPGDVVRVAPMPARYIARRPVPGTVA